MAMKFLSFLFSKTFLKNLAVAFGFLLLIFITLSISLRVYTHHGKAIIVPDVRGLSIDQASKLLTQSELRFVISDSIYSDTIPKGAVAEQIPKAGSKVKKNRKLFLILNSTTARSVSMPNLSDLSVRYAKSILESSGLKSGQIIYVYSEFKNLVIGQHFNGMEIPTGTQIEAGSSVDLLVANGLSKEKTAIPYLKGMRLKDAKELIRIKGLHPGAVINEEDTALNEDSLWVWKQIPYETSGAIPVGSSIALWLTTDTLKWVEVQDTMLIE